MADNAPHSPEVYASETTQSRDGLTRHKKIIRMVLGVVAVALLLALLIWILRDTARSGYQAVLQKTQGPCTGDHDLIADYNQTVHTYGTASLGKIRSQVEKKDGYQSDATCRYMLTMAAYGQNDTATMQKQYVALKKLMDDGKKPSSRISDGIDQNATFELIQQTIDEGKQNYYGQG